MRVQRSLFVVFIFTALLMVSTGASPTCAQTEEQNCGSFYTVEPGDTLSEIALLCGVSYSALLEANPDIDNPQLIYPGQVILVPSGSDSNGETPIPVTGGSLYIVKPGDTLERVASRFQVSTQALLDANPWLRQFDRVYPGMRLTLPRGAVQVPTLSITPTVGHSNTTVTLAATGFPGSTAVLIGFGRMAGPYYQIGQETTDENGAVVREFNIPDWADEVRGDYVFVVQNRNNPNVRAISNFFNLTNTQVEEPVIPDTGEPTVETYTVKAGDTLSEIAQMFNTTLDALLDLNPSIGEAAVIYPGQTIALPQGTRPAGPYVTVSILLLSPGDEMTVKAYNFPSNAFVDVRLAPKDGNYIQPYDARTNARGNLTKTIRIPDTVENGEYRIIVTTTERREITRATSQLFNIND